MSEPSATPPVGRQLAERRDELNLSQVALAELIGVTSTSVSAAENGRSSIQRGKRSAWERALALKPGTISRAYARGTLLEPLDDTSVSTPSPYADMSNPRERAIWEMSISEADRRMIIDLLRQERHDSGQRPA
ncbi:helix-turn-helix domain-containing protein [Streptomyces sp.]|uniref:helix-turn-helix domain-containing protein n=1 Tax=Streptomyces sp. TaxID=1931 RepID=UPI002F3F2BF8